MSYTVHIKLPAGWQNHRAAIDKGLKEGLHRATILVTNKAIDEAPRRTGNLKRSIRMEVSSLGSFNGKIVQDKQVAKYGACVEYGTKPHTIEPLRKKALFWNGAGHPVRKVKHPGTKAQPFMRPALRDSLPEIEKVINEQILLAIREAGG